MNKPRLQIIHGEHGSPYDIKFGQCLFMPPFNILPWQIWKRIARGTTSEALRPSMTYTACPTLFFPLHPLRRPFCRYFLFLLLNHVTYLHQATPPGCHAGAVLPVARTPCCDRYALRGRVTMFGGRSGDCSWGAGCCSLRRGRGRQNLGGSWRLKRRLGRDRRCSVSGLFSEIE